MILILNAFITDDRARGNRYPRLDVFRYALFSYSKILFSDIYLFIKLDNKYSNSKDDLLQFIHKVFKNTDKDMIHVQFDRLYRQSQWGDLIRKLYKKKGGDQLVLFLNNDDHVFVDYDTNILCEGLDLLSKERNKHKSMYISHWPEIIKLSGKHNIPESFFKILAFLKVKNSLYLDRVLNFCTSPYEARLLRNQYIFSYIVINIIFQRFTIYFVWKCERISTIRPTAW